MFLSRDMRTVPWYILLVILVALPACNRNERPSEKLQNVVDSVLLAGKAGDVSRLVSLTVGAEPQDIDEISRKLRAFGWQPPAPAELERMKKQWLSMTTQHISVFLASYKDLFDGKPAKVVTAPIDLARSTVDTPSGPQAASAVYGHIEMYRVIVWVQKGSGFKGIYLPEIYRLGSRLKVNSWVKEVSPRGIQGELMMERAILECKDLTACGFPESIQWRREYRS